MKRLIPKNYYLPPYDNYNPPEEDINWDILQDAINKLGQLEDIEEKIGIEIITLLKALKNGCYVKPWKEIKYSCEIRTGSDNIHLFLLDENDNDYLLKDYGKTWALTKEALE